MANWVYIENGEIKNYYDRLPDTWKNISNFYALENDIDFLKSLNWFKVIHPEYTYNPSTQKLDNRRFIIGENTVTEEWDIVDIQPSALPSPSTLKEIQNLLIKRTQKRLDDFAKTRNYNDILSACSYINDPHLKFQIEAQYCINLRSQTWLKLYQIQSEIQQGLRPIPVHFGEIESELPELEWPELPSVF